MNRKQKINFLKAHGIDVPENCDDSWLALNLSKFENRMVNFKGGHINVLFDKKDESPVEVMIYEDIGADPWGMSDGFTAKDFVDALKDIPKTRALDLRINSAGGQVWEGLAIKTHLDEWKGKKTASIDGMAASVASWLPMAVDEIRAPRHAQMFIHDAWGMCMGNAQDMRSQADDLEKTSDQIAQMYASKAGGSVSEWRDRMKENSLFTAEEANKLGLIDRLTDEEPVQNFTALQIRNMKSKLAMLNSIKHPAPTGGQNAKTQNQMKRKEKIALLNRWGVSVSKNATDAFIDLQLARVKNSLPKNTAKFKNGKDGEHTDDCDCADCSMKNAPEPDAEAPDPDKDEGAGRSDEGELWKQATKNSAKALETANAIVNKFRKDAIQTALDKYVTEGRIPANSIGGEDGWLNEALLAEDGKDGTNTILNKLAKLPPSLPGIAPLNIEVGESDSIEDLDRNVQSLMKPANYFSRNGTAAESQLDRMTIGQNSKRVSQLINRLKQYDPKNTVNGLPELTGPLRQAYDKFVVSPRNANTMSTGLLRQVILSEVMRAFRRQFTSLTYFAHNFGNIPLEGTDIVQVPYYPLDTIASTEFNYANGYVINPAAQTLSKSVTVGGIANGVASAGSGRKYKALAFTAYEVRRQPWLDIQKLSVMAGEQLAIDVRADIIGTQICAANFGNAIWTGGAGGFDHTVLGNVLMLAAINAYWPLQGRNVVVAPAYFSNLAIDPGLYPYLYSGSTDILNKGVIQDKYGFENILHDPILPVANYIQGGSGNQVNGLDPYLAGYMCWPSAVLIATAPIMPPPGVLKKLVAYEQITDDQTNLAFTYQFFGDETKNRDNEIIECTYGSGLGELKALFRLTSQGV